MANLHWYLVPLLVVVAVVYSATRFEDWGLIWRYAIRSAVSMLVFLGVTYVALYIVAIRLVPFWLMVGGAVVLLLVYIFWGKLVSLVVKQPEKTD